MPSPAFLFLSFTTHTPQIHNLFSLLSLQVVYVTSLGRLTGVVSLKDLRRVIENVERGHRVPSRSPRSAAPTMDVVVEEQEDDDDDEEEEEEEQPLRSDSTDV